ncbi:MAG TPA: malectin domain-containing carbohydrate-binding protein, partial [Vicinamibacteria bacterium]
MRLLRLVALAPIAAALVPAVAVAAPPGPPLEPVAVVSPAGATAIEAFAAREVRRYVYVRTGRLLPLATRPAFPSIVVARRDRAEARALADARLAARLDGLAPQERLLVTVRRADGPALLVTGGDDAGVLYAAYRLAERLGVRFGLHGDTLPDVKRPLSLPELDEAARPLFEVRGIQPFHDFPEGPDWWSRDDYKAVLGQIPKLGLNFFGLHTYPEGRPNAEPTVWIGPPDEVGEGEEVKAAYPASWFTTVRGNWGYEVRPTGDYAHGAGWLFHRGAYGNDVMEEFAPQPWNADDSRLLFARAADVLNDAFAFARRLGTRTAAGTETPLVVPKALADRLATSGRKVGDLDTTELLYEGMFRRIAQSYPLDYFWFWTPEGWTWEGVKDEEVKATVEDLRRALAAAQKANVPFALATCGWVLGPPLDRTLFDRELPKDVALSCINRTVGHSPVERGFAAMKGRPTWAIPWMEDDPALTSPQLWAGRLRRDAADARRYGATGLIGIHWRTRVLAPNVQALAEAAWRQDWPLGPVAVEGPIGGYPLVRAAAGIAATSQPALYRDQRCGLAGYRLRLPDGRYTLTLRFADLERGAAGERVFDVLAQGRVVAAGLDLAKSPGPRAAHDVVTRDVAVSGGWLDVGFVDHANVPCLAAIEVAGPASRRVNVGGPAVAGHEADLAGVPFVPTSDFWRAWAEAELGPAAAPQAAALFERLDSRLPQPATWIGGPGGLDPDDRPWAEAKADYAFVDELEALRPHVRGAASLE